MDKPIDLDSENVLNSCNSKENATTIAKRKNFMLKHVGRMVSVPQNYFGDTTMKERYIGKIFKVVGYDKNKFKVRWNSDGTSSVIDFSYLTIEPLETYNPPDGEKENDPATENKKKN